MAIDLRALRYCEAVARNGSFTKASKELGIAQPALSIAIKKLEEELGVSLFVRKLREVVPNPEALLLLKRAERIFEELRLARQEVQAASELRVGEIKIGMPPMFGVRFLAPLFREFSALHPDITFSVTQGGADETRALLDSGALDLAMLESRRVPPSWQAVEVGRDEMVLCMEPEHPLAAQSDVSAPDLSGLRMVVFGGGFLQRRLLDDMVRDGGVRYTPVLQSNSVRLIQEAILNGLGCGTLMRSLVREDGKMKVLSFRPPVYFYFSLCWRRDLALSNTNRSFVDFAVNRRLDTASSKSIK